MKSLVRACLFVALACGGKTLEEPGTEIPPFDEAEPPDAPPPSSGGSGSAPTPTQPPPNPGYGGSPAPGYGGSTPTAGSYSTGGSYAVGGGVGTAGGFGYGGGYGGSLIPPYALEGALYRNCEGVAFLPAEGWFDFAGEPQDIFLAAGGHWLGHASSPWGDWQVEFYLGNDGTYSAYALSGSGPALYYGTDLDSPLKHWEISGSSARGAAGLIDVIFWYPPDPAYESGYQGVVDCMHLDGDQQRLRFEFWYGDEGQPSGPFVYDLYRY